MQALIGKSLDFLCTGGTPFIVAYLEGAQGRIIAGVNNRLPYGFVTRASITTPAQLKGKRIGISRFGSTDDFAVKLALAQFGLNPKSDVNITQVGRGGGNPAYRAPGGKYRRGRANPWTCANRSEKRPRPLLLDFIEKDIEYQQVAIIGREDILKTRGDVVHRFMKAYLAGIQYYKTQKEVAIRKIMQFLRTNDRQIAEFDYTQRVRALPDDGKPTIKGMQLALDDIAKDNPKARSLTVQQLIDLSFLQ